MSMPLTTPPARLATLERAACPERFQARWASIWARTRWQGYVYEGHAPSIPEDDHREKQRHALYAVINRWDEPTAFDQLHALLVTGGMVHTPNAPSSPWSRLLKVIPEPFTDAHGHWERLAHLMVQHGASVNEVVYPCLLGEPKFPVPPIFSIEDPPEVEVLATPGAHGQRARPPLMPVGHVRLTRTGSGKSTMMNAIVRQLLDHPCSTPLAQAASSGHAVLAHWLMNAGADPFRASPCAPPPSEGESRSSPPTSSTQALTVCWALPFMIAEWSGHPDLADELEAPALALAERQHLQESSPSSLSDAPMARRRL